jgi:hypothetical protein
MTLDQALRECQRLGIRPIGGGYGAETVAYIAIAAAVVSAAVGTYAAYEQGEQQKRLSRYNQKVAENQALAAQNAATVAANRRETLARHQLASQRAAMAASGIAFGEGTPLLLQMESAEQAALDVATIRAGGETQARGFQAQGNLAAWQGRVAKRNSYLNMTGAILGGVSSGASAYSSLGSNASLAANNSVRYG